MDGIDLSQFGLGGGVLGAIALVIVTLIKARTSDKTSILSQQAQHMDRLAKERNDAVTDRDKAWTDAEKWRELYEGEIRKRIEAETRAATASAALQSQLEALTREVNELRAEVARLNENTGGPHG